MQRITTHSAFAALREAKDQTFTELFKHGSLTVEIYQPKGGWTSRNPIPATRSTW